MRKYNSGYSQESRLLKQPTEYGLLCFTQSFDFKNNLKLKPGNKQKELQLLHVCFTYYDPM